MKTKASNTFSPQLNRQIRMTKSNSQLAREFCAKFPRHSQKAIAAALKEAFPERFLDYKSAHKTVQRVNSTTATGKGAIQAEGYKKHAPCETKTPPALPESFAEPWDPVQLCDRGQRERVFVLSDVHVPYHDKEALETALEEGDKFKPTIVFLNGDICDFYQISRWERDPAKRTFKAEIRAIQDFLAHLRARYRKARIVLKLGNHEERWWPYVWKRCPELLGLDPLNFPALIGADKQRVEVIGDQRIVMLGKLPTLHGHELPKGLATPVNPARGAFMRSMDCVLMGHQHRTSEHTEVTLMGKMITCWSTGCLSSLHPEYARVNRWNHGAAEVIVEKDGNFNVNNYRIWKGKRL